MFDIGLASSSHLYLAQVAFQFNLASVTGIVLAVGGAALYAVRSLRPHLSRDHDIFFSAVGLLCGLILIFYGWRFDPIMQFGQVLLSGSAIFFVVENLRLRQVSTEQAKRGAPIVDTERPVSRVYQADFDDRDMFDDRSGRSIRSGRDGRSRDDYEDRPVRRTNRNEPRLAPADRSRPRRPSDDPLVDDVNDTSGGWGSSSRSRTSPRSSPNRSSSRPKRRPSENVNRPSRPDEPANYVDYRPIEPDDNERDNWSQ
ncbi:hypothetical protein GS601_02370 [Myxacorys almedinensis A]|uniref:Ycf66 n=2 Tax=Myxacorys TaxID=2056239 RepID=A0A8J7Z0X2_9CYAN|nr:hypothetical protein [Myxacorys almedinensis A]